MKLVKNVTLVALLVLSFGACASLTDGPRELPRNVWLGGAEVATGERADRIIVGSDDTQDIACFGQPTGAPWSSQHSVRYTSRAGTQCTATLVTNDGWLVVPDACRSPGLRYGKADVWYQVDTCGGNVLSEFGGEYAVVEERHDPQSRGVFLARLSPSPTEDGWAAAMLGVNPAAVLADQDDEFLAISVQPGGTVAQFDCHVTSGPVPSPAGERQTTDCDFGDPKGVGGSLIFGFNGSQFSPMGGCVPGTGPTSPGALPGRLAGFYSGRVRDGVNEVIPFRQLVGPGGILTPLLANPDNWNR